MKSSTKTLAALFGLIVVGGIITAGVFVAFGSQEAVYAAAAILPTLALGGGLWVRRRIAGAGTDQTQYTRRRAREVGETFSDVWTTRERIRQEYPALFGDGLGVGFDALIADLGRAGIEFDRETGAFRLGSVGKLEDINALAGRVQSLDSEIEAAFAVRVRDRIEEITRELKRIGRGDGAPDPASVPEKWQEAGQRLDEAREYATAQVDDIASTVQEARASIEDPGEDIEKRLAAARTAVSDNRIADAMNQVLDAQETIRRSGDVTFSDRREKLRSLLSTIEESDDESSLAGSEIDTDVSEMRRAVEELDDATNLSALAEYRDGATEFAIERIQALEDELSETIDRLERADVPDGFYVVPEAQERTYAAELRDVTGLREFESAWKAARDDLTAALNDLEPKADVVSGYDQVRPVIEDTLQERGQVTAADLPVRKHETQFLGLYYRENPESVSFDINEPSLSVEGNTQVYEVTVTVSFDQGGPDREVTVSLEGDRETHTETVRTPLVGTATFSVPYGEYEVEAVPDPEDFGHATTTVKVTEDTEVSLDLKEITLIEQVCDEHLEDAETYLAELSDVFKDRFDEEGYLGTEMSYRIESEYVPCLLALWAGQTGHEAVQFADGRVIVYDEDTIRTEVANVLEYNLESGESLSVAELPDRFLSAPVPDNVLTKLVKEEFPDATVDDDQLLKK